MKNILIIGAGVGGMSTAHHLSKSKKYTINVIERHPMVGGLARTLNNKLSNLHNEYCWKAIGSGYVNFLNIMNEIYDEKNIKVISRLKPVSNYIYAMNDRIYIEKNNSFVTKINEIEQGFTNLYNGRKIPFKDKIILKYFIFKTMTLSDEQVALYDDILWSDYVKDISPDLKRWILDSTSIYLGMDYKKISVSFIMSLIRQNKPSPLIDNNYEFYSFSGPMNEVLFKPWKTYLEKKGVIFHMESTVKNCNMVDKYIKSLTFSYKGKKVSLKADAVVNSTGCESLAKWYEGSEKNKYIKLAELGNQIQTQILFYINEPILIYEQPTVLIMPDSPWFLMTRIESTLWNSQYELLSTGIGIWDVKGILHKKCAIDCNPQELAEECWYQIQSSQHNLPLGNMPEWNLWDSFKFDEKLATYEPKFSNNAGTLKLRPHTQDADIQNLFHATAYTRTKKNIYNMESAAEAGTEAAAAIKKYI